MATRKLRNRILKLLTDEDRKRHQSIREQIETEKPRLREIGLKAKAEYDARQSKLQEAVAALKATRQTLGLSLAEIQDRTGIAKANLSRLENAVSPNPTIETLARYADAVGKEIVITLSDKT